MAAGPPVGVKGCKEVHLVSHRDKLNHKISKRSFPVTIPKKLETTSSVTLLSEKLLNIAVTEGERGFLWSGTPDGGRNWVSPQQTTARRQ